MNIMIVSRDSFFVAGAFALIVRAWRPDYGSHPVFIVAEEDRSLLLPDVIITDEFAKKERGCGSGQQQTRQRLVNLFLAERHRQNKQSWCAEHPISLPVKESARQLVNLFGNRTSPLFLPSPLSRPLFNRPPRVDALSKQQAMVLKYTRQGMSLTDISRITQLSVKTISTHKRAIMRKLGIKNNGEFYQYAFSEFSQRQ